MKPIVSLAVLLFIWLPFSTEAQMSGYYVMDGSGNLTHNPTGDPNQVQADEWRVQLYRCSGAEGVWGTISGSSAEEVMKELKKSQEFDLSYARWGYGDESYAYREPLCSFKPLGPIAVIRNRSLRERFHDQIDAVNEAYEKYEELRDAFEKAISMVDPQNISSTGNNPLANVGSIFRLYAEDLQHAREQLGRLQGFFNNLANASSQKIDELLMETNRDYEKLETLKSQITNFKSVSSGGAKWGYDIEYSDDYQSDYRSESYYFSSTVLILDAYEKGIKKEDGRTRETYFTRTIPFDKESISKYIFSGGPHGGKIPGAYSWGIGCSPHSKCYIRSKQKTIYTNPTRPQEDRIDENEEKEYEMPIAQSLIFRSKQEYEDFQKVVDSMISHNPESSRSETATQHPKITTDAINPQNRETVNSNKTTQNIIQEKNISPHTITSDKARSIKNKDINQKLILSTHINQPIPAKITYESPQIINYTTSGGTSGSINKSEILTILSPDGNRQDFKPASEVEAYLAKVQPVVDQWKTKASGTSTQSPTDDISTASPSLSIAELSTYSRQGIKKVDEFVHFLTIITDKKTDPDTKDKAIEEVAALFLPQARIEVTSVNRPGVRTYPIKEYLSRLKLLPYSSAKISWNEVHYVKDLTQETDGNYYGIIAGSQKFEGYGSDGKSIQYSDITQKTVKVKLQSYQKSIEGQQQINWEILLGNIGIAVTN